MDDAVDVKNQACSPDPADRAAAFVEAVRKGDRVSVSTVNAIGGWDTNHFSPQEVLLAIESGEQSE